MAEEKETEQHPLSFTGTFVRAIEEFSRPWGIACTPDGQTVVVDNEGWKGLSILNQNGEKVSSFVDSMRAWSILVPEGQCYYPRGVTVDGNGDILLVDGGVHRIQKFRLEGGKPLQVVGGKGRRQSEFDDPIGIGISSTGEVYVCDRRNNRIQVFDDRLTFKRTFGQSGTGPGEFCYPWGVAFDSSGNIYIADVGNYRIQVLASDGEFLRQFGTKGDKEHQFLHISSLCIDQSHHLYVTDRYNHCVKIFTLEGKFVMKFGSQGSNFGEFNEPMGIAIDNKGFVHITDSVNSRVQVFH